MSGKEGCSTIKSESLELRRSSGTEETKINTSISGSGREASRWRRGGWIPIRTTLAIEIGGRI